MAIKIQGSTIIDDGRQIVGVSTIFVDNVDPTTIGLTTTFSVNSEETSVLGVTFSDDGTRMFIIGSSGDNVSQYSLSTPWDLSTASYVSGEDYDDRADGEPRGVTWSWDGKYFYTNDREDVYQHEAITPFSLTGAYYIEKTYNYSAETASAGVEVKFKIDGTKMYVSESSTDRIYQYSLATPWDVSTASYDSVFADFGSDETALTGFAFNPSGTKLIICGNTGDKLIYYTLSTPWDLSTLSSGTDLATGLNNPYGIYWRKDGGKLYVANTASDNIVEYTITQYNEGVRSSISGDAEFYGDNVFYGNQTFIKDVSTRGDLSVEGTLTIGDDNPGANLSINGVSDLSTILRTNNIENSYKENNKTFSFEFYDNAARGVGFKTDGTRMYMSGEEGNDITEFELSTPWEVGTASPTGVTYFLGFDPGPIKFKPDGTKLFVTYPAADDIREYDLPTPWDLTSITGLSTSFNFSQGSPDEVSGLDFTPDGSRMFVMDRILDNVHEYSLSTPWSVDTAVGPGSSFYVGTQNSDPFGIAIDPSGVHMYIVGIVQNNIYQYEMSTAFDIRTATYTGKTKGTGGETDTTAVFIKPDGSQIFITGYASDLIRTFDLSTPFDVSTGVGSSTFSVGGDPYGLWFKPDGTEMYVSKQTGDKIDQYTLSSAWDVSTAGFTTTFFTGDENNLPTKVQLSPSGDKMFISDHYLKTIVEYPLSVAWDVSSASTGIRTAHQLGEEGTRRLAGFAIDNGGTRLYALDSTTTNRIIQYEMSTAFDVSTISYNGSGLYLRGNGGLGYPSETESRGLTFNKYGTKLFTSGYTYDQILQFNLTVPYDLRTASFEKNIYSQMRGPSSLEIDSFNSRLYVVDSSSDIIVQFDTKGSGGNDLDLDLIEFKDDSFYLDNEGKPWTTVGEDNMHSVFFSPDGRNMYTTGHEFEGIYHYRLSTPWDVRTSKIQGLHDFYGLLSGTDQDKVITTTSPYQLYFREDGKFLAVVGQDIDRIYSFELETAWEISSITRVLGEFYIGTEDINPECLWFSNDGVYMYSGGENSNSIFQYTLSTPWDITTASLTRSYNVNSFETTLAGISFSGDGRKLYFIGYTDVASPKIHEHILEIPWDISSVSTTRSFGINSITGAYLRGLYVRPDMSEFFVLDLFAERVHRYKIPTGTVEFTSTIEAYGDIDVYQDVNISGRLNTQGAYIENYLGIGTDGYRNDATLVSKGPARIPSIGNRPKIENLVLLDESFSYPIVPFIREATSMHMSPDGKNLYLGSLYVAGDSESSVVQYKLKTAFDVTTAEYSGHYTFNVEDGNSGVRGIFLNPTGTKLFAHIRTNTTSGTQIVERILDLPWDISSISIHNSATLVTTGFGNEDELPYTADAVEFNADGTKLYYLNEGGSAGNAFRYIYEHTLSTPYDLSTVSAEPSFTYGDDTVVQSDMVGYLPASSDDLQFNNDGTKLFVYRRDANNSNIAHIYQYHLTTPYDLSTLNYEGITHKNYHVTATIYGFHVSQDGKKLYINSYSAGRVYQFELETAWDFSSYKYPKNISGILTPPGGGDDGAYFCDHGKKFYSHSGSQNNVSVYNLKRPYDLTTLISSSDGWESLTYGGEFSGIYGLEVSEDGMNAYAACYSNSLNGTAQFKFHTPFDFTTMYPVVLYKGSVNLRQATQNYLFDSIVSPDGKKLYELDYTKDLIYEHDIKVPFDLRTARRTEGKLWTTGNYNPIAVGFGTDGKTVYWLSQANGQIWEARTNDDEDLYDIRTMSWSGITTTTVNTTSTKDFAFNNDGSKLYTLDILSDSIHERTLTYNGNIRVSSGATSYSFASDGLTEPQAFQFKSDGSSLFVVDNGTDAVYQYALATPFAVDTISGLTTSFSVSNEAIQPYSLRFKPDGTKMFVLNYAGNGTGDEYRIYSYNLSTAWDVSTASYTGDSFKPLYKTWIPEGIEFSPDGKRLLVSTNYFDSIYQFELSIPWDITTATYETTTLDIGAEGNLDPTNGSRHINISPDGRTLIVQSHTASVGNQIFFQYQLKTPWRINTASFVSKYRFNTQSDSISYEAVGRAHFDWDNGDVYIMIRANTNTNVQVIRAKLSEYNDNKTEVFGGLDVYGKSRFEGSIDVKESSRFEYIGIGTDNSLLRSKLVVDGNANLPSISPNEMDIENYYFNSKDFLYLSGRGSTNYISARTPSNPYEVYFSPDGRYMYTIVEDVEDSIQQYELSIPWDISTAKLKHGLWVASTKALETAPRGVGFGSDGNYMYLVGENQDTVFQWTLGTPYQINTAGFTTSFSVNSEEGTPQWVGFSTGGDRMYILGDSDEINEYSLSTPWFVDSASFDSNTALDSSLDENSGYIKPDGTKIWTIDASIRIHEFDFGTPWDSSTLTIATKDSEEYTGGANALPPKELNLRKYGITSAEGLYFSPDGFNMYVTDLTRDAVFRFHMETAWDFQNARIDLPYGYLFDDITPDGTTEITIPEGLTISPDGTRAYVVQTTRVYEFVFDTPWEVSTIRYEGKYYDLHSHGGAVQTDGTHGLAFKPDGTKMFVVSGFGFYQYLNGYDLKTPWDILTATPADRFDIYDTNTPECIEFNNDGTKFFIGSNTYGVITEYECTVPWNLTTARCVIDKFTLHERNGLLNANTQYSTTRGFDFKPDGSRLYVYGSGQDKLFQVDLEEYWQVKTGQQKYEVSLGYDAYAVRFKPDGLKVYLTDYANSLVKEHTLTTAWDITTLNTTPTSTFSTAGQAIQPLGIEFKPDGTKMWIAPYNIGNDNIYEYDLSPAWDITSATASHQFDPPGESKPSQIQFSDDGSKFYVMGDDLHTVQQFDVYTPWDISSIRSYQNLYQDTNSVSYRNGPLTTSGVPFFYVKRDGSLLFMSTQFNYQYLPTDNSIVQYTLDELYDVRTARIENRGHVVLNGGVELAIGTLRGMSFNGDGSRLYVTSDVTNYERIWELELAVPFKIDTATISGRFINLLTDDYLAPGNGVPFVEANVSGMYVKKDGTRIYFTGTSTDAIWQIELPSKPLDLSGNVRVHGELNTDYTIHTPELKASYIDADRHVSIGSTNRSYGPNETALTVHGKSDISKIHRESKFREFTINTQWMYPGSADATPTDIYFKPGGRTLYVQGSNDQDIDEWALDAPYDLRNAKWVTRVSLNEFGLVDSRGLQFKPDGTKLFATDTNTDDVFEFSLSTPWDITTVGLTTVYITSEDTAISGLHIGAGGTTMYLTGYTNDDVYQYSISTAWDLTSTVAFTTSKSLNEDGITQPEGIYVSPDGTRMFVTDISGEEIAQYEMSTPFDVSTAGLTTSFHSGFINPFGIEFVNDGMEFVLVSNSAIGIAKYSCEEPYNINTTNRPLCSGRLLVEAADKGGVTAPYSVNLKPDGTKLYVGQYSTTDPDLYEYDLRIPWDIGSAKLNQSLALPTAKSFTAWRFKPDGTKMYGLDYDNSVNSAIEEYELTRPWDISSAGLTTTFVFGNYETQPIDLNILPDGSRFYINGTQRDSFLGWEMTRPWDLRSARRISKDFYVGNQEISPLDIAWGDSGRKLYILGDNGNDVTQYTLTNGGYGYEYDLRYVDESTATTFSVATQDTIPTGFHFKSDGTQMWVVGDQNDKIYEYNLSTAWDVTTASIGSTMSGTTQATPYDMTLSDDGEYVYVYGAEYQIHQYRLSTPYDITTIGDVISESYYMPSAIVGSSYLAIEFGRGGTRLYVTGSGGHADNGVYRVHQFNLSEAWNIRTAEYINSFRLYWYGHTQPTVPQGITFRPDGKQFTVVCNTSDYAVSYDLETPWELNSAHYDGDWRSYDSNNSGQSSPENVVYCSTFNSDGTELYIIGDSHNITKWDLRVPYDFTTASTTPSDFYLDNFSRFAINTLYGLTVIYGMYLAPDDEKLYITTVLGGADAVWEFKIPREKTELLGKTEIKSLSAHGANIDALQTNSLTSNNIGIEGDLVVGDASAEYETTIQFETPTANRIVTIPDRGGFVGIVPGGSYKIMYNDGSRLSAGSSFTYNPNYGSVVLTGGNITTTTPYQVLNLSQTWNNASGIYTGIQLNITDTNSSASSKLVDLQVDTTTVVDVFKDGAVTLNAGYIVSGLPAGTVGQIARVTDANAPTIGAAVVGSGTSNALCWYNGSNWSVIGV